MPDYADTLASLQKARDEARELLVELHGATKDAKQMKTEVREYIRESAARLVVAACMHVLEEQQERIQRSMVESVEMVARKINTRADEVLRYINEQAGHYQTIVENIAVTTDLVTSKTEQIDKMYATVQWCHDQIHRIEDQMDAMLKLVDNLDKRVQLHAEALLSLLPESEESGENQSNDRPATSD